MILNKNFFKNFVIFAIVISLLSSIIPFSVFAQDNSGIVADWNFNEEDSTGSISNGNLVIKDKSNNGNDLRMNLYSAGVPTDDKSAEDWDKYLKFSSESVDGKGSIEFDGEGSGKEMHGADFVTVNNAPINKENFKNGYTIEVLYYLPKNWTESDKWMGVLARQVDNPKDVETMDEPELGSMSLAVSNCKEFQFLTANANDSHKMQSAAWAITMDKGGQWYHLAIVSDNDGIRTYVNGAESFRDYKSKDMVGMFADPKDGRFRVGSSYWKEGEQILDKFLKGNIERIRIANKPLDRDEWIEPNPEKLAGDFGRNDEYNLRDENNYNFVFMPDTQNTVKFKTDVMNTGIDEFIKDKDRLNVKGVMHLGDVVENYDDKKQFDDAYDIFSKLPKAGVDTLMMPGNHDYYYHNEDPNKSIGDFYYKDTFGSDSEFASLNKNVVYSPSGRSSYMKVKAGSYEYLILSLSWFDLSIDSNDYDWAENVLKENRENPTIVTSHNIVDCSPTEPNSVVISDVGENIWALIKKYDQVFMTVSGHFHGAGHRVEKNDAGDDVIMVLSDYQFGYNGGNAFFKFAEFSEDANKIYLSTYSPYAASLPSDAKGFFDVNFMNGDGNDDVFDFNFDERFKDLKKFDNDDSDTNNSNDNEKDHSDNSTRHHSRKDRGNSLFIETKKTDEQKNEIKISDIEGHWAEDIIRKVVDKGYMDLIGDKFYPEMKSTRITVVKALAKMENVDPNNYKKKTLDDLDINSTDSGYVNWAIENNIIKGYEDNTFKGDRSITREEMATILNRYVENLNKNYEIKENIEFSDASDISDWAKSDVKKAVERGIFKGRDDKFYPTDNIKRAEVAQVIENILEK
ncbi:S-layer homology domain-containing protein [Peptoniphilus sp.]|jgi:hypothetical protein|uniref:S-layer homology domain-containing protein n=1 Tax=Peptoniphilus sp. TaxID=1971214 RepID=UPI003D918874